MPSTYRISKFLRYWLNAIEEHSLHTPFIYDLYREVINVKYPDPIFEKIEQAREALLNNQSIINITDYGAGSSVNASKSRAISDIAKHSLSGAKISQLAYRLIKYTESEKIIELGTSLGINTLYLRSAAERLEVTTFEGCPNTANYAKELFSKFEFNDITMYIGDLNRTLHDRLGFMGKIDFAFMDAHHTYDATMKYFNLLAKKTHDDTLFLITDIYWSKDMERAWKQIVANPIVTVSIDLFEAGIVFFKPDITKQHFILEF